MTVRAILQRDQASPTPGPGWGWGFLVSGLPPGGATAVVCDACIAQHAELSGTRGHGPAPHEDEARAPGPGATAECPEGPSRDDDPGVLQATLAADREHRRVVIHFGRLTSGLAMTAREARQFAEALRQKSYQAEGR